jgi:integrase
MKNQANTKTQTPEKGKAWTKTRHSNLWRHKSGYYYIRASVAGKQKWRALGTDRASVAEARMGKVLMELRTARKVRVSVGRGVMSFADAASVWEARIKADPDLADRTKEFYFYGLAKLRKSWPELDQSPAEKITRAEIETWRERMLKSSPFVPPNAKTPMRNSTGCSRTTMSRSVAVLRAVLDIALESGAIHSNPGREIRCKKSRKTIRPLERTSLPSSVQFLRFVMEIETAGARQSKDCADFVRFLAFSGARCKEAANLMWSDIDFPGNTLRLRITKNGEPRSVSLIPEASTMLKRMRNERKEEPLNQAVLRVREAQKSMDRAAARVGMIRITHHGLRHLFVTKLIESGVDIPTAARLAGHKDGGALAMRVYGHLRDDHAQRVMAGVSFSVESK